ncbi:MAG: molybdopterin-dependent oxidoreductase [Myxococcota bacterium]
MSGSSPLSPSAPPTASPRRRARLRSGATIAPCPPSPPPAASARPPAACSPPPTPATSPRCAPTPTTPSPRATPAARAPPSTPASPTLPTASAAPASATTPPPPGATPTGPRPPPTSAAAWPPSAAPTAPAPSACTAATPPATPSAPSSASPRSSAPSARPATTAASPSTTAPCSSSPSRCSATRWPPSSPTTRAPTSSPCSAPTRCRARPRSPRPIRAPATTSASAPATASLVVVDPRRSATAAHATHLAPRVGTDVFLLAWLLRETLRDPVPERLAPLVAATAPHDLARTARVTGLPPDALLALRDRLHRAERPLVWSGLGVLLGPHGLLGWWLTLALQDALGGLGRPGGWRWQPGLVDVPAWARRLRLRAHDGVTAPIDGWPAILGTLPAATLPADVLRDDPDRLRALIVVGGDPRLALPDAAAAERALRRLDLLVCLDVRPSATAELAHALLPAATWLERDASGVHTGNQRPVPHLRLDRAVIPPVGEAREDLAILADLAPGPGGWLLRRLAAAGTTPLVRALAAHAGVPWREVTSPRGALGALDATPPAARPAVPAWCDALAALPDPEPDGLRLVTSVRPIGAMNHWLGGDDAPRDARIHPDDWPHPPGDALLVGPAGAVRVRAVPDPTLARGTVVVPFGGRGGHPNAVVGATAGALEPFTGQPVSNGARVTLRPTEGG